MPNVNDLKKSAFLKRTDFPKPAIGTIVSYDEMNVAKEGAEPDFKWTLSFKEFEKPLVLNSTNGQIIAAIVGSGDFDAWIGHRVVLYDDPNVSFAGKLVGGIRIRAMKQTTTQPPTVKPLDDAKAKRLQEMRAKMAKPATEPTPDEINEAIDTSIAELESEMENQEEV